MQAYCLNEFAGLIITCDEDEFIAQPSCPPSKPRCFCPVTTGEEVIKTLNFPAHMTKQANMLCLTAILLGVHMLAFIALSHVVTSKEKKRTKLQMPPPAAGVGAAGGVIGGPAPHLTHHLTHHLTRHTPGASGAMGGGGIVGAPALTGPRSELIYHQQGYHAASYKDISGGNRAGVAGSGPVAVLDTVSLTPGPLAGSG